MAGVWRTFLSAEEHSIVLKVLGSQEKWEEFINLSDFSDNRNQNLLQISHILALRIRGLLFEAEIPRLFARDEHK